MEIVYPSRNRRIVLLSVARYTGHLDHLRKIAMRPPRRQPPSLPCMIGIDPSLNGTGVCIRQSGGTYHFFHLQPSKGKIGIPRLLWLREQLNGVLMLDKIAEGLTLAIVEGYSMGSASRREAMGEWGGVLRCCLADAGIPELITVPPQTLKKFVIGHAKPGDSGKDVMLLKTFQRWGQSFNDSDQCD